VIVPALAILRGGQRGAIPLRLKSKIKNRKMKALLYKVENHWYLEPVRPVIAMAKAFKTAAEARLWARKNQVAVKRCPNCDSL